MSAFPMMSARERAGFPAFPLKRPSIAEIAQATADHYGVSLSDIYSPRRTLNSTHACQVVMFLSWELTTHSSPMIGRHIGNRDHATILHEIAMVRKRMAADPEKAAEITALKHKIGGA